MINLTQYLVVFLFGMAAGMLLSRRVIPQPMAPVSPDSIPCDRSAFSAIVADLQQAGETFASINTSSETNSLAGH